MLSKLPNSAPRAFIIAASGLLVAGAGAALADGTMAGWGVNNSGQLGDQTTTSRSVPVAANTTGVLSGKTLLQFSVANSGSFTHVCAVASDGAAYCWGANGAGQLGNPAVTATSSNVPVAVNTTSPSALSGKTVTQIATAGSSSCAVTTEGLAYCWGSGNIGQLGNGGSSASTNPVAVSTAGVLSGNTVTQISGGTNHFCAVASGAAYCWGQGSAGQLGNGLTANQLSPVSVTTTGVLSGKTVIQVDGGSMHTCAVTSDGGAYCWGVGTSGQLGNNDASSNRVNPVAVNTAGVLSGKKILQISAGEAYSCAVADDYKAYCWGANSPFGRLGNNSTAQSNVPVAVDTTGVLSGKKVVAIEAGFNTCALTSEGQVYCWGGNVNGELGINSTVSPSLVPVAVNTSGILSGKFVTQVGTGRAGTSGSNHATAPAGGPGRTLPAGASSTWQQIALPCTPSGSATVASVFGTGSPMNLTTTDYGVSNTAASTGWVVRRYNPTTNAYETLSTTAGLVRGTGYWFKSLQSARQGLLTMTCPDTAPSAPVTQAQGCASANGCFALRLTSVAGTSRYNLLGNPFPYAVDWADVRVRIDGSSTTYTPSQAAGVAVTGNAPTAVISNIVSVWNGTSYTTFTDSGATAGKLPYFRSFWVQVLAAASGKTVELLIPAQSTATATPFAALKPSGAADGHMLAEAGTALAPPPPPGEKETGGRFGLALSGTAKPNQFHKTAASAADLKSMLVPAIAAASDSLTATPVAASGDPAAWSVRLFASDVKNGWTFEGAFLGQQPRALTGWDPQDMRGMAPFAAPYMLLTFPRPGWGTRAGDYASDFRPTGALRADDWPFDLRASQIGSTVHLRREGDAPILARSQLINVATGEVIAGDDPRWSGEGIPVTVTSTVQKFIWRYLGP